jgi:hypothetical protein
MLGLVRRAGLLAGLILFVSGALACALFPDVSSLSSGDASVEASGDGPIDAPADAGAACDPTKPFGAPTPLAAINTAGDELNARLTHDELTIYFVRYDSSDGGTGADLYTATRPTTATTFSAALPLSTLNTGFQEWDPSPTGDNLTLYFTSDRTGSVGHDDIWVATRTTTVGAFGNPTNVSTLNSTEYEDQGYVLADGLTIYLASNRTGAEEIYRATRTSSTTFSIDVSQALSAVDVSGFDYKPVVSQDELTLYFARGASDGGQNSDDIWVSQRASTADPFGAPTPVTELDTPDEEDPTWLSDDGCRLYFERDSNGSFDVWVAVKP